MTWPALSLRQPFLWAVTDLGKPIENRKRLLSRYKGPIWLHASRARSTGYCIEAFDWMNSRGLAMHDEWPGYDKVPLGGICGYAEIVDVIKPLNRWRGGGETGNADIGDVLRGMKGRGVELTRDDLRWWMTDQFGFVLRNVTKFPVLHYPGSLGLFKLKPELEACLMPVLAGECPCQGEWDDIGGGHVPSCPWKDPNFTDGAAFG